MKKVVQLTLLLALVSRALAATTINPTNHFGYGANIGWMDFAADTNSGAVIGEFICSGWIYSANVGWISLGNGSPTNGIRYQNISPNDFGVNHDGQGNLRGLAYGANIGWINFESNGAARVDLFSGSITGHVYSANAGWIGLRNAFVNVRTDAIARGTDSDGDGIPDAWERLNFGNLTAANATSDFDGDGRSDLSEYGADTDPKDTNSLLRITTFQRGIPGDPTRVLLGWNAQPTRFYGIEYTRALGGTAFSNLVSFSSPGTGFVGLNDFAGTNFYRLRAFRPLTP